MSLSAAPLPSRAPSRSPLHVVTGTITPRAPFVFSQSLAFLDRFSPMAGEQSLAPNAVVKALRIEGQTIVFRVEAEGDTDHPRLRYEIHSARPLGEAARRDVEDRIGFFLSVDDDVAAFYALAEGDAELRPRVRALHGMHHVKFLTPFENAVWAVLGQRQPMSMARRAKRAIVERFSAPLEVEGQRFWAFPEPRDMAAASEEDLLRLVRNDRRARSIRAVIDAFLGVDDRALRTMPYDEVEAFLRGIYGLGAWSSAFVLFRGLGRCERTSMDDHLREAAQEVYGEGTPVAELERIAARYGEHQGYWALYLRAG